MRLGVLMIMVLISVNAIAAGLKPSVMTMPPKYLSSFPLGTLSESDMLSKVGPPDRTLEIDGKKVFVYQLGQGYGLRTFTYTFDGGVVVDVLYNDSGPYNGMTAKQKQADKH
jgi:hypothetical protein